MLSDGSLLIKDIRPEDNDNYTCHVENERGDDQITYTVIVQTVPGPVSLDVSLTTTSSVDVVWKEKGNGGSSLLGFKLFYKRDQTVWESIELDPLTESHRLDNLQCGTKYQLYMVAFNSLGSGKATSILNVSTKGGIPIIPKQEVLIEEGSTFVTLNLHTWQVDSCPLKYFVVEYKTMTGQWKLFSDDVQPEQRKLLISDLIPATWYSLRMIAHSNAGIAAADYTFATLTKDGATILPEIDTKTNPTNGLALLLNMRFIIIASSIFSSTLLVLLILICYCSKSKSQTRPHHLKNRKASRQTGTLRSSQYTDGCFTYSDSDGRGTINSDDMTPYATARLSDFQGHRRSLPEMKSAFPPVSRPNSAELLSFREQLQQMNPSAPPLSDSYGGNSIPFYSQVQKGDQVLATPSRRNSKVAIPLAPPLPKTPAPEITSQSRHRSGDATDQDEESFIFPPPPPPIDEITETTTEEEIPTKDEIKYDAPWDVKNGIPSAK